MRNAIVLAILLMAGIVVAADPPPIGIQTLFKTAPKPSPAGAMPRLVAMQGSNLVQLPLSSAKPALATTVTPGIVKVGTGLAVTEDGTLTNTGMNGVASYKNRGGAVTPLPGDYSISMITGAATVASTGNYSDLLGKPTIPAAQVNSDWNAASGLAQILNKPTIPSLLSQLGGDTTHRTVTDSQITTWSTSTASVNSVNGQTATVVLTATDVGADPLGSATSVQTNLNTHTALTNNPHSVTKAQVGLANADNTSDANKPVSTATQAALDLKANSTALPSNTSAVSHYFLTGYNSSTKAFSMVQPSFADIAATPTTLAGYGISDAQPSSTAITTANIAAQTGNLTQDATHRFSTDTEKTTWNAKESALGNPSSNGYVLSSTAAGVRSWVAMTGGGGGTIYVTGAVDGGSFNDPYSTNMLIDGGSW